MNNNNPIISVIVPVYNVENYLPHCLESIQGQTFKDFEVLLIDDGSTDASGKICDKICSIDKRFNVIHQENQGYQTARNTGLGLVKGEYISFVDADDYIHPQMLDILYRTLIQNPGCAFSMCYGKMVSHYQENHEQPRLKVRTISQPGLMRSLLGRGEEELQYQVVWNKLYRKEVISGITFTKTGTEDTVFNGTLYLKIQQAVVIEDYLYYWVQRSTSITHQITPHYIDRMNSYSSLFQNIPQEHPEYKALCLEKLYKTMLHIRYHTRNSQYKVLAKEHTKKNLQRTLKAFCRNKYIELHRKAGLLLFLYIPAAYNLFMYGCECLAKRQA